MGRAVKEDVKAVLGEFHARIRFVVERAWTELQLVKRLRSENSLDPLLYPRTFANDMYDAIARYAIEEFMHDDAVHIEIESQTIKLFFRAGVVARFKKGDDERLGRNIATQAALRFVDAEEVLPGFPPETAKVEFIWLSNELNTRLEHVLVVARDNDTLLWEYEIESEAGVSGAVVVPFPRSVGVDDNTSADELVTPRVRTPAADEEKK